MLMQRTLVLALIWLAACGAQPAPEMFGAVRKEVVVDGRQYVVYQKQNKVEVIRLAMPGAANTQASAPR